MPTYIIVDISIHDHQAYEGYKALTPASLVPFEGKFIVRGGRTESLEGEWHPERIVVLEFPTAEQAKGWWSSEVYAPAKTIRQMHADTRMLLVEGV